MADEQRDIIHKIYATEAELLVAIQPGRLYFALDTQFFYLHDGSIVQKIPSSLVLADQTGVYGDTIIGSEGIPGLTPTGGADGDPSDLHSMLEGLANGSTDSFEVSLTGCTTIPTGTAYYNLSGNSVILTLPFMQGISNTDEMMVTGLPNFLIPLKNQVCPYPGIYDNSIWYTNAFVSVSAGSGDIIVYAGFGENIFPGTSGFTGSGTKGIYTFNISYMLK